MFLALGSILMTLLERVATGDETAVELCVQEYGGLIYRIANRYLDQARDEVEDAVQEVFIEIWTSAKRFDVEKGSEAAFVATIAHRRVIDRQRQVTARRRNTKKLVDRTINAPGGMIAKTTGDLDQRSLLANGFDQLPDMEREALWLSIHRGLTHHEIGIALGVPIGTIKSRLRRAMIRMGESVRDCSERAIVGQCEGRGA